MPNGVTGPTEATCIGCNRTQTSQYPGGWGRSPSMGILLLDIERSVGLCTKCVTPANLSKYWRAIAPPAVAT